MVNQNALGYHYLIELFECNINFLKDSGYIEKSLQYILKESGATEIGRLFHKFSPQGVSGVFLISESHFSIHTWPEHGYAAVDFFTCSAKIDIQYAYKELIRRFQSKNYSITEIRRGSIYKENQQ